jgi:hypothetical protein
MTGRRTSPTAARKAARAASRAPEPVVLADDVAERIASYTPSSIEPDAWTNIRPLVIETVTAAAPPTPDRAQHLMLPAAKLVVWAIEHGVTPERSKVFTPALVEEWARAQLAAGTPPNSIATHRSHLRALLPTTPPPGPKVGRGTGTNPYDTDEDLALRRAVMGQRTPVYRSTGCLLYGLARGAGLNAAAIRRARRDDVIDHGEGGIELLVGGRSLWVLDSHLDVIRLGLETNTSTGYLLSGRNGQRRNIAEYVSRFTVPTGTPHLKIGRCRSTWILDHLRRGTPIKVLADALGTRSLSQIEALLAHVDSPVPDLAARALRGGP